MLLYDLNGVPTYSADNMSLGCSYNHILDICVANGDYRGKSLKEGLKKSLRDYIEMIIENTNEEFELALPELTKELQRRIK